VVSGLSAIQENDKGVQTEEPWSRSTTSHGTPETPNSNTTRPGSPALPLRLPGGPPPPHFVRDRKDSVPYRPPPRGPPGPPPQQFAVSDGETSASPISDFEDLYSDDDHSLKPRLLNIYGVPEKDATKRNKHSDDEDEPDPWNAMCIIGLRVYSKDEGLEVRIYDGYVMDEGTAKGSEGNGTDGDVEDAEDVVEKTTQQDDKVDRPESKFSETQIEAADSRTEAIINETTLPTQIQETEDMEPAIVLGKEGSTLSTNGSTNSGSFIPAVG